MGAASFPWLSAAVSSRGSAPRGSLLGVACRAARCYEVCPASPSCTACALRIAACLAPSLAVLLPPFRHVRCSRCGLVRCCNFGALCACALTAAGADAAEPQALGELEGSRPYLGAKAAGSAQGWQTCCLRSRRLYPARKSTSVKYEEDTGWRRCGRNVKGLVADERVLKIRYGIEQARVLCPQQGQRRTESHGRVIFLRFRLVFGVEVFASLLCSLVISIRRRKEQRKESALLVHSAGAGRRNRCVCLGAHHWIRLRAQPCSRESVAGTL